MYIDLEHLECHVIPEGAGFLAYVDLGKDENGKRVRPKSRGKSEDDAIAKLEKKLRKMYGVEHETTSPMVDVVVNQFTPIPDFVQEYRVNYIMKKVKDKEISSRTAENYVYNMAPFEKYFSQLTIGEVTTSCLNQFFRAKAAEKDSFDNYVYSQVTLNRIEFLIRNMIKRAIRKEWLSVDPFNSDDYKKPKSNKVTEKIQGLDPEEIKSILNIIKGNPVIYAPIMLMLNTGMRTQEVLALKWRNIDFDDDSISIENAVTVEVEFDENGKVKERKSVVSDTKTEGSKRQIGLTPEAKKIMLEWMEYAPIHTKTKMGADEFVFGYEQREHYSYNAFKDKVNDFLQSDSRDIDKVRLHRIRHTVGTLLAAEGREVLQIMRQLGITQEKTLQRYVDKKANKKIMQGNVLAINKGLSDVVGIEDKGEVGTAKDRLLQVLLKETEGISDSKVKALTSCLVDLLQGE